MAGKSKRLKLQLSPQRCSIWSGLRGSRTAPVREVQRAEILWRYHSGKTIAEIMRTVKMTRKSVGKWIDRALAMGVEAALKDAYHRPQQPLITADAKAWVVHLACSKPKQLGYAAELWTRSALALHVRRHAVEAGYPALDQAAKATVHRILAEQPLHPEKVKYYLERRDPDFESKMRQVLLVYREVAWQNESPRDGLSPEVITVSVDEKPGVQAIANVAPDLPPKPGRHPSVARDYEYKRLVTCSILAALDLHSGRVTARVERRHRSREFILLLQDLDQFYPDECTIRLILDNHPRTYRRRRKPTWRRVRTASNMCIRPPTGLAQHSRDAVWQDGAHILKANTSRVLGGASGTNPGKNREINAAPVGSRWRKFESLEVT